MVPKAAFDALVQQIASLQATIDRLTALLEEKNQIILNQNRARFGQSSEKRTYLLSDGQMCLFDQAGDGITENTSGEESHTEEITVAAHTRKSKRTFSCSPFPRKSSPLAELPYMRISW